MRRNAPAMSITHIMIMKNIIMNTKKAKKDTTIITMRKAE